MIEASRAIAILRGDFSGLFKPIALTLAEAGIRAMEVTMNSPAALDGIRAMKDAVGADCLVGAGTVLSVEQAEAAIAAGAEFIVAPNTNPQVIAHCLAHGICVIPGAYTPTEITHAFALGAHLIKLFPAELAYFKAIRGPLNHVPFVVTGGVNLENASAFIRAGAVAVGLGSQLVSDDVKAAGGLAALAQRARQLMASLSS
jgi:2-dehydro-3-deoxyphosphogluconate aldolase/(4S)-4-hydroxy-2-oxoglutarate aldolase